MALIDRTTKPPAGIPLRSDGHWSVQGLAGAWPLNEGSGGIADVAGGNHSIGSTGAIVHTADGITTTAADSYFTAASPFLNPSGDNWSVVVKTYKSGSSQPYILFPTSGDSNNSAGLFMRDAVRLCWTMDGYNSVYWDSAAAVDQQGLHTWCITKSGSGMTHKAYRDGADLGAPSSTGSTYTNSWANFKGIGANYSGFGVEIQAALFYHRTLTAAEVASLSANPWQVFEQISDGAGGTTFAQSLDGAFPAPTGAALRKGAFGETLAGGFPAPSGTMARRTGKMLAGDVPAASGTTAKKTGKGVTGAMPPPNGATTHGAALHAFVSGIMGAIAGAVATAVNPVVAAAKGLLRIMGAGIKKIIGG